MSSSSPTIVVHGGAGAYRLVQEMGIERRTIDAGVTAAARAGYDILLEGGTAMDAVQAAVVVMENDATFNAGVGSYLTADMTIEMDACIMDGATLKTGAVGSITNVNNPILVARAVLDKTPHTMICGEGAKQFAQKNGFEIVPTDNLVTQKAKKSLEARPTFRGSQPTSSAVAKDPNEHDTVGAVALDGRGNLAAANSTGGITAKMCGRVGDSPIVGAGPYADNSSGAVCSTGDGEAMVRVCTCKHAAMLMEQGWTPQRALVESMEVTARKGGGFGGCVAVNCQGEIGVTFNTEGMAWVSIKDSIIQYELRPGEENEIKLNKV